jgi:hypothetical protein
MLHVSLNGSLLGSIRYGPGPAQPGRALGVTVKGNSIWAADGMRLVRLYINRDGNITWADQVKVIGAKVFAVTKCQNTEILYATLYYNTYQLVELIGTSVIKHRPPSLVPHIYAATGITCSPDSSYVVVAEQTTHTIEVYIITAAGLKYSRTVGGGYLKLPLDVAFLTSTRLLVVDRAVGLHMLDTDSWRNISLINMPPGVGAVFQGAVLPEGGFMVTTQNSAYQFRIYMYRPSY